MWGLIALAEGKGSWRPVFDGDFLKKRPEDLWREGAAKSINFMTGNLNHDTAGLIMLNPVG